MAKHTPGPWRVAMIAKSERVLADAATPLGIQIIARLYRTNANREADATLIAAAPDLLEALKGIIAGFDARAEAIIAGRKGGLASQAARRARVMKIIVWGQLAGRRVWCALLGHYDVLQVTRGRVYLRCTHCLRETPGWHPSNPRKRIVVQSLSSLI